MCIVDGMDTAAAGTSQLQGEKRLNIRLSHSMVHRHVRFRGQMHFWGRLAQLDRALVSGTRGRVFKSHIAYHAQKS